MAGGSFLTSRELFDNPIWQNIVEFRLFFLIYGNAIFAEEGVKVSDDLTLQRGQWLRSTRKLQEDLKYIENRRVMTYSVSTINRTIKRLERLQRVCTKQHQLGTVFTVLNYEQYQGFGGFKDMDLERNLEQPRNNNKNVYKRKDLIYSVFEHWMSKDLVKHRSFSPQMQLQIQFKLNNYSSDELMHAIDAYESILNDPNYKLSTRWGLLDFLEKGHFEKFLPDRDPYSFYPKFNSQIQGSPQKSKFSKNKEKLLRGEVSGNDRKGSALHPVQGVSGLPEPD